MLMALGCIALVCCFIEAPRVLACGVVVIIEKHSSKHALSRCLSTRKAALSVMWLLSVVVPTFHASSDPLTTVEGNVKCDFKKFTALEA